MKYRYLAFLIAMTTLAASAAGTPGSPIANPLQPFERLVGGKWYLEGSFQVFEWGVGRRSVKGSGFVVVDGSEQLVSEGAWFWHPAKKRIRGYFTAVEMPVEFFDYTTRFDGDVMVNDLKAYTANGKENVFVETWTFIDADTLEWSLTSTLADGSVQSMSGTYVRSD